MFFSLIQITWRCNPEESLQSSWPHPPPGPWSLQTAPINQQSMISPTGTSHSIQAWQELNSWPWAQLTATEPLNYNGCDYFSPNVSIYAQGILNYQGNSKIQKFKICIDQELNSWSPGYPCHLWSLTTRPSWLVICCSNLKI